MSNSTRAQRRPPFQHSTKRVCKEPGSPMGARRRGGARVDPTSTHRRCRSSSYTALAPRHVWYAPTRISLDSRPPPRCPEPGAVRVWWPPDTSEVPSPGATGMRKQIIITTILRARQGHGDRPYKKQKQHEGHITRSGSLPLHHCASVPCAPLGSCGAGSFGALSSCASAPLELPPEAPTWPVTAPASWHEPRG